MDLLGIELKRLRYRAIRPTHDDHPIVTAFYADDFIRFDTLARGEGFHRQGQRFGGRGTGNMVLGGRPPILSADAQAGVVRHEPDHLIGLARGDLQRSAKHRADLFGKLSGKRSASETSYW